jgi:Activator of Hsp90 ATPase homolog 1-like protein
MEKPSFVYTTYIHATPERLWQALTEPAFTKRYWDVTFETDWAVGSMMTWDNHGFEPGSKVAENVSGGWPVVMAQLKTMLETGEPLRIERGTGQSRVVVSSSS